MSKVVSTAFPAAFTVKTLFAVNELGVSLKPVNVDDPPPPPPPSNTDPL